MFQDSSTLIHTSGIDQDWFYDHNDKLEYLMWLPQSLDLKIIEPFWGILESNLRSRFCHPRTLSELETQEDTGIGYKM